MPAANLWILVVVAAWLRPQLFFAQWALFFSAALVYAQFVSPRFDHGDFLPLSGLGVWEHLSFKHRTMGAVRGYYGIWSMLPFFKTAFVYAGNAAAVSASIIYLLRFFAPLTEVCRHFSLRHGLLLVFLLTSPIMIFLFVGANRDLLVGLALAVLFAGTLAVWEALERLFGPRFSPGEFAAVLGWGLLIALSAEALLDMRAYIVNFFVASCALVLLAEVVHAPSMSALKRWNVCLGAVCAVCVVLFFKWPELRMLIASDYSQGNSTIRSIVQADAPGLLELLPYALYGLFTAFVGIFTAFFEHQIGFATWVVGVWDYGLFACLCTYFFCFQRSYKVFALLMCFILLRFGVQVWATPNFGTFMRVRTLEMLALAMFFLFSVHSSQGKHALSESRA